MDNQETEGGTHVGKLVNMGLIAPTRYTRRGSRRCFDHQPTLDTLRLIERDHGAPTDRLDPWQAGPLCTNFSTENRAVCG